MSSSGHLALLEALGVGEESLAYNLLLHLATLLAVCVYYRKRLWALLRHPLCKDNLHLLIATVPSGIIAFLVRSFFDVGAAILPFGFVVSSVALFLGARSHKNQYLDMNKSSALVTGIAQGVACFPGISRSGLTITTMLLLDVEPTKAADFSFLLSIPIIVGSGMYELITAPLGALSPLPVAVGMAVAFVSGLFAIKLSLAAVKKGNLLPFSLYTGAMAAVSGVLLWFFG